MGLFAAPYRCAGLAGWLVLGALTLSACTARAPVGQTSVAGPEVAVEDLYRETVFAAETALFDRWRQVDIRGSGDWGLAPGPQGELGILGVPQESASAVYLDTDIDPFACPVLEWEWTVGAVQPGADLTDKETDDVAAALFVLFGDPGTPLSPNPVPTLRYVWTTDRHSKGDVIPNPYLPELVRNIVIQTGAGGAGSWRVERRNIVADFEAAFGEAPDDFVWAIALFVDNDQTGEPASAHFRRAAVYCD
ncbi:MAG: DUF3047 domain-containing protein [Alphaproteobacteria bacterium]